MEIKTELEIIELIRDGSRVFWVNSLNERRYEILMNDEQTDVYIFDHKYKSKHKLTRGYFSHKLRVIADEPRFPVLDEVYQLGIFADKKRGWLYVTDDYGVLVPLSNSGANKVLALMRFGDYTYNERTMPYASRTMRTSHAHIKGSDND